MATLLHWSKESPGEFFYSPRIMTLRIIIRGLFEESADGSGVPMKRRLDRMIS